MMMKAGELAMQKGTTAFVRRYGDRLVRDHRMGDRKVTDLAASEGIELVQLQPQTEQEQQQRQAQQQMMQKLQQTQGAEFDTVFLQAMQKAHKQAIQQLTQAHDKLANPEVREFVGKLIPILGQHQTLATHLQQGNESA